MPATAVQQKPHIQQVDYIRAIASLAVALFHTGGRALPGLKFGWLGVQMFFLLSGFVICWAMPRDYNYKMTWRFIKRRIIRIEPPYLISLCMAIASHYLWNTNYKADWADIILHIGYLNDFFNKPFLSPVYWTLAIEFQFYIFIALVFPLIIKKWGPALLVLLCIVPILITVPGNNLINAFPIFAIGITYYLYRAKFVHIYTAIIYGFIIAVCCFLKCGVLQTFACLFALLLLTLPLGSNRVVSFFSKISFSLYLTHDLICSNIVAYLGMHLPKTLVYQGAEFILGIAASIAFAYIFYLLVEKRFLELSKRVRYRG